MHHLRLAFLELLLLMMLLKILLPTFLPNTQRLLDHYLIHCLKPLQAQFNLLALLYVCKTI